MALEWLRKDHERNLSFALLVFVLTYQYKGSVDSSLVTRLDYDVFANPNPNVTNGESCRIYESVFVGGFCHNSNCSLCQCSSDNPTYIVHLNRCVKDAFALSGAGTYDNTACVDTASLLTSFSSSSLPVPHFTYDTFRERILYINGGSISHYEMWCFAYLNSVQSTYSAHF